VALVSSASGSKSQDNTKKNRIRRTQKKAKETELEDHLRKVKSSLNKASVVDSKATSSVINYVSNVNSNLKCASCNGFFLDYHDACVVEYINSVNARKKSKSVKTPVKKKVWKSTGKVFKTVGYIWKPTGRTFTLVGNVCPLTRIATDTIVPPREPILIVKSTDKPVVTLVYTRKPKAKNVPNKMKPNKSWGSSSNVSTSITDCRKPKVANKKVPSLVANKMEPNSSWGSSSSNVSSPVIDCGLSKSSSGYGDYQIRNVTISRVYYVEGLGHNLFSVGQFCDSDLEVAIRQHTCFIRNLDGVDLLTGSRGNNLYTLSLQDVMASSPICLLSKASKTKSWIWHRRLSHLNFGAINHLARQGLVRLKVPVRRIQTDNGTEFVNQTLRDYYEEVGISHKTSVARSPQQNKEALATACFTQNRSIILLRHGKTPYELLDSKLPDLSFFHVFSALCYPTNDSENLVHANSTDSPSSTTVDQDVPSLSKTHTTTEIQSIVIPQDVEDDNMDMEVAHVGNDPLFGVPIPEVTSAQSSSTASPQSNFPPSYNFMSNPSFVITMLS
nr:integrase, catalytic region, zinc finger, CCHC-type, peptidase aspartic, catalytic [Tanacetum cinerariifolium]